MFRLSALAIFPDSTVTDSERIFAVIGNDPTNETAMLGLLVSLCLIALSKEKDEDEIFQLEDGD